MGCGSSSATSSRLIQDVRRATNPRRPSQADAADRGNGGRRSTDNSHSSQRSSLSSMQRKSSPRTSDPNGQAPMVLSPLQTAEIFNIVRSPASNEDPQAKEPSSGTGSGSMGRRRSSLSVKTTGEGQGLPLPNLLPPTNVAPTAPEPLFPFPVFEPPTDHPCSGDAPGEIQQRSWALVAPRNRILAPDSSMPGSPYPRAAGEGNRIVQGFTFPPINDSTASLTAVAVAVESPKMERSTVFGGTFSSLGEQSAASRAFDAKSASLHANLNDASSQPVLPPLPIPVGGDTQLIFHPPRAATTSADPVPNIVTFGTLPLRNRVGRPYVEPVRIPSPPAPPHLVAENPLNTNTNPRRRQSNPLSDTSVGDSDRVSVGFTAAEPASSLYWQQCLAFQPKSFWQRHEADNQRREAAHKLRNDAYVPPYELQSKVWHWLADVHNVAESS